MWWLAHRLVDVTHAAFVGFCNGYFWIREKFD
jgi:hypothetical protein